MEAEKVHALSSQVARLRIDREFVSQVDERHHALMAEMEDTQAKFDHTTQRCDELTVQWSRLQRDLDAEKSRRAKSENAANQVLAEAKELATQLATLKGEKIWWVSHGVMSCFEFLRRSPHFSGLLDDMATTAYETGRHDGMHAAYLDCNRPDLITERFWAATPASNRMAETMSAVANDPLPELQQIQEAAGNPDPDVIRRLLDSSTSNVDTS
ncbi:hypothetical protein HanPI659440_Chr01g0005011 [Helianthus annuus]|nr:hypothetical protein HanPI659440_Chr01g0005011 [Helianthus annuus]